MAGKAKYKYNSEVFTREDATSYYLLGVWMSDGNVVDKCKVNCRKGKYYKCNVFALSISIKDREWVESINNLICPQKLLHRNRNQFTLRYSNVIIQNWLLSKGCVPNKTLTLEFPNIPQEFIPDFVRGYFDGDGSIMFKENKDYKETKKEHFKMKGAISSGSPKFIYKLQEILKSFNIETYIDYRKSHETFILDRTIPTITSPHYTLAMRSGEDLYKFCKFIYPDNRKTICLERKYQIAQEFIKYWERPFFCLECDVQFTPPKRSRGCMKYCSAICRNKVRARIKAERKIAAHLQEENPSPEIPIKDSEEG